MHFRQVIRICCGGGINLLCLSSSVPQLYTEDTTIVGRINSDETWIAVQISDDNNGLMISTLESLEIK